ncbi:hypothetical protein KR067_008275, partial [Drosophila pandora]
AMLSAAELARLCRICLRQLKDPQKPNSRLICLLKKFLDIDILHQDAGFPTDICNLCHNAVAYFEELRQVARETGEKLCEQLKDSQDYPRVKEEPLDTEGDEQLATLKEEHDKLADNAVEENLERPAEPEQEQHERQDFRQEQPLPQHKQKRAGLACNECGKQVYKLPYLEAHIRSVHQGHSKPFLCRNCDKSFTRYEQLRSHQRNAHPQLQQQHLQELRELICELCNRQYSTKNALGEHLKRHAQHKEHVCEQCGVAKVTRTELLTHMRTHNPTWERFKCEQCPQLFRHKSAISRHVRVVHEGQRRFQCGYCEKRFGTHASQLRHERVHSKSSRATQQAGRGVSVEAEEAETVEESWPLVCIHCQEPCVTRQNLELHLRRHSGRKRQRQHYQEQDEGEEMPQEETEKKE